MLFRSAHEHLLGAVVDAAGGAEEVAVAVHGLAALVRGRVHGHDHQVLQQPRHAALPGAEALEEEVQQGARARPRRVDLRHDHRPILGRGTPQHLLKVAPRRRRLQRPIFFAAINQFVENLELLPLLDCYSS